MKRYGMVFGIFCIIFISAIIPYDKLFDASSNASYNTRTTPVHSVDLSSSDYIQDDIEGYTIKTPYDTNIYQNIEYSNPFSENAQGVYSSYGLGIQNMANMNKNSAGTSSITTTLDGSNLASYSTIIGTSSGGVSGTYTKGDFSYLAFNPQRTYTDGTHTLNTNWNNQMWTKTSSSQNSFTTTYYDGNLYTGGTVFKTGDHGKISTMYSQDYQEYDSPKGFSTSFEYQNVIGSGSMLGRSSISGTLSETTLEAMLNTDSANYGWGWYGLTYPTRGLTITYNSGIIGWDRYEFDMFYFDNPLPSSATWQTKNTFHYNLEYQANVDIVCSRSGLPYTVSLHNMNLGSSIASESRTSSTQSTHFELKGTQTSFPMANDPYYEKNFVMVGVCNNDGWTTGDWIRVISCVGSANIRYINSVSLNSVTYKIGSENYVAQNVLAYYDTALSDINLGTMNRDAVWSIDISSLPNYDSTKNIEFPSQTYVWTSNLASYTPFTTFWGSMGQFIVKPHPYWEDNYYTSVISARFNIGLIPQIWRIDSNVIFPYSFSTRTYFIDETYTDITLNPGDNSMSYTGKTIDYITLDHTNTHDISSLPVSIKFDYFQIFSFPLNEKSIRFDYSSTQTRLVNNVKIHISYQSSHTIDLYYDNIKYILPAHPTITEEIIDETYASNLDLTLKYYCSWGDSVIVDSLFIDVVYNPFTIFQLQNFKYYTNGITYTQSIDATMSNIQYDDGVISLYMGVSSAQFTYYTNNEYNCYIPTQTLSYYVTSVDMTLETQTITNPSVFIQPEYSYVEVNRGRDPKLNFTIYDAQSLYYSVFLDGVAVSGYQLLPISNYITYAKISYSALGTLVTEQPYTLLLRVTDGVTIYDSSQITIKQISVIPDVPIWITESSTHYGDNVFSLEWQGSSYADYYKIYQDGVFLKSVFSTTTTITLPNDFVSEIKISACNVPGESAKSEMRVFRTINQVPNTPNFITTNQTIHVNEIELEWDIDPLADGYKIFQDGELKAQIEENSISTLVIEELNVNRLYVFNLVAYNIIGNSEDSEDLGIIVLNMPDHFDFLTSNKTLINNSSVRIDWETSFNAEYYLLFVNGTEWVNTTSQSIIFPLSPTNTTYLFECVAYNEYETRNVTHLLNITTLYYKPFAFDFPSEFELCNGTFNITWNPSEFALYYIVYFNSSVYSIQAENYFASETQQGDYNVTIEAINNAGSKFSTNYLLLRSIYWFPLKPVFENISMTIFDANITINWFSSENATKYYLFCNNNLVNETTDLIYYMNLSLTNTEYRFYLIAENSYGNSTPSDILIIKALFILPNIPNVNFIEYNFHEIGFSWDSIEFVDEYYIFINGNLNQTLINQFDMNLSFPIANNTYEIQIIASNELGNSSPYIKNYEILIFEPKTPSWITMNKTLKIDSNMIDLTTTLRWETDETADYFKLYINGVFVASVTGYNYSLNLSKGEYDLVLISVNNLGESEDSNVVHISVIKDEIIIPENPEISIPTWGWVLIGSGVGIGTIIGIVVIIKKRK